MTWDKNELVNMSSIQWLRERRRLVDQITEMNSSSSWDGWSDPNVRSEYDHANTEAEQILHKQGLFARWDFQVAVAEYLELSLDRSLMSENPIIRALAMFDRRLGKRRLEQGLDDTVHPLVRLFHRYRCEAEGIQLPS